MYTVKKVREFPVPSRDVTTNLSLGGNNDVITELFLPQGSLVSDIPAGDGKLVKLFLWFTVYCAANVRGSQAICMLSSANYFACRSLELRKIKTKEIEVNEHVNERDTAAEGDMSDRQTEERGEIL